MASLSRNPRFCNLEAMPGVPMQQCHKLRSQVCPSRHSSPCALLSFTTCFIATGGMLAPRQASSHTAGQRCDLFKEVPVGRIKNIKESSNTPLGKGFDDGCKLHRPKTIRLTRR